MEKDIEAFRRAVIFMRTESARLPVKEYIYEQGKQIAFSRMLARFKFYMIEYPVITMEDFHWFIDRNFVEWNNITSYRSLVIRKTNESGFTVERYDCREHDEQCNDDFWNECFVKEIEFRDVALSEMVSGGGFAELVRKYLV